jgi:hypothetical protein
MRRLMMLALAAAMLPACLRGASGDWKIFVNASAVNRITARGDSLWCGTRGGILLFDLRDSSFAQYVDGLGFRTTDVSGVAIDGDGSVWAAFVSGGVARIDHIGASPSVKLYSATIDGLVSDSVTCVARAGDDIYYGSANGAAKFFERIHTLEPILSDSLSGVRVNDLLVTGDTLWAACDRGVALFNRVTLHYVMFRIGRTTSLASYGGTVHCAGLAGVERFDQGAWTNLGKPGGVVPVAVSAGGGVLAAITPGAAFTWSGSSWTNVTGVMKDIFASLYLIGHSVDILRTVAVDSRGTPWVGGMRELANRGTYITGRIRGFWSNKAPVQLTQNGIVALALEPGEGIWASTRFFGLSFLSNTGLCLNYTKMSTPSDPNGLSYFLNNLALLFDSQGSLWVNSLDFDLDRIVVNDPLNKADDVWSHYALNTGTITSNRFVRAKEDPAGNRWFLSDDVNQALGYFGIDILSADGTHWLSVTPTTAQGMAGGSVFDVSFAAGGKVAVALRGYGVQIWRTGGYDWANLSNFSNDVWQTIIGTDDLPSVDLFAVAQGPDGAVWTGTASGLVRYLNGAIDSITIKTEPGDRGLLGSIVSDLAFDGLGNLWVATDRGLNEIAASGAISAYTTAQAWQSGLYPSSVISPLPSASCKALLFDPTEDVLWIGTDNGIARLDVSAPETVTTPLARLILYPNPVYVARGDNALRIGRISGPVTIKVFTVEGELVHEASGVTGGGVAWDLYPLTSNSFPARSGVYIVRVSNGRETVVRKVAVIR